MKYHKGWNFDESGDLLYFPETSINRYNFIAQMPYIVESEVLFLDVYDSISSWCNLVRCDERMGQFFIDPFNPSPPEYILFELEFGIPYPDKEVLQLMKEA